MKKITLIIAFLVAALVIPVNAQSITNDDLEKENQIVQYCLVNIKYGGSSKTATITIDYGFGEEEAVTDKDGNKVQFNGRIACINYMTLRGWKYLGHNDNGNGGLMFRRVVTQEEAQQILKKSVKTK